MLDDIEYTEANGRITISLADLPYLPYIPHFFSSDYFRFELSDEEITAIWNRLSEDIAGSSGNLLQNWVRSPWIKDCLVPVIAHLFSPVIDCKFFSPHKRLFHKKWGV